MKKKRTASPHNLFPKIKEEGMLPSSFCDLSTTLVVKPDRDNTKQEKYGPTCLMNLDAKTINKILTS